MIQGLLEIPPMGRRKKFSQGKLCGRNELIAIYIWNSYLATLEIGESPCMTLKRTRKQVSSHIQVLKEVFKGQQACKPDRDDKACECWLRMVS